MPETQFSYKSKRNDLLHDVVARTWGVLLKTYYSVHYEHTERLQNLKDQGFILLPKHQRHIDILLEGGLLLQTTGRRAHYVMAASLPKLLIYLGGIGLTREKDIRRRGNKRNRKEAIYNAQKQREYVDDVIRYLLNQKGIVVIHSEGERNYKKIASPKKAMLRRLIMIQNQMKRPTTFVPLDIHYESRFRPRSSVILKVGNPIQTDDVNSLEDHLINEIELFV